MISWVASSLGLLLLSGPVQLDRISSGELCGRCHRDILRAWKTSSHATALEDPIFLDALDLATEEVGAKARTSCLGCHAPTVQYSGDVRLQQKVSWEGVTCDFCHSVKAASVDPVPRLRVEFDGIKTGPLKDAVPLAHGVAFSAVHTSSLLCAGCHEYRNPQGLAVLTTYSEWQNSQYAGPHGGKASGCQECHMSAGAANVVDPKVQRVKHTMVNLHQMPGGHSIDQLNKAVTARLNIARDNDNLQVKVDLTNRGAGHMVPTGSPLRKLLLEVQVSASDGKTYREQRTYQRTVVDSQGKEVSREHEVFLRASRATADNRLKPGEMRAESFRFAVPRGSSAHVRAVLWYYYSPLARTEQQMKVSFLSLGQYAAAAPQR